MAAYAAAVSLLNAIDQIKIHPFLSTYFNQYSIESLREMVDFFVDFLEKYSDGESEEAVDLVRRIGDVAHETEEIINVEAAHRIRIASTRYFLRKNLGLSGKLRKITTEMDCIKEKALSFMNPDAEDLVRRMEAVALEAGDIFEFKAADQIRSGSTEKSQRKPRTLQREKRVVDSNKEKAIYLSSAPPSDAKDLVRLEMAATAYSAAVSLLNTIDQIKIHPFLSTYFNQYSIESLREMVDFFVDFLEKYSDGESEEAKDLVRRIADVAHETEEIINVEAARRIRVASTRYFLRKNLVLSGKLRKITTEMDCIKEKALSFMNPDAEDLVRRMAVVDIFKFKDADQIRSEKSRRKSRTLQRKKRVVDSNKENVIKAKEKTGFQNRQPTSSMPSSSSSSAPPATAMTTTMVGFDAYLEQLLDQLTGYHSGRQILPIVGMGGIGKTTLATNVYQNPLMLHHFDIRAWITVSQQFSARDIILQALSCLGGSTSNTDTSDDQLGVELSKILYGRRYLVVLDDVWSVEAWEKIMFFFPENNNGSRIIVTTRESELVDYFGSSAVFVDFLDEKNSWELFCKKTFAEESCPPELEEIGKEIVEKCKGLPLAITVFGGLLRKSPRIQEYWEIIAKDKSSILDSGEGDIKPLSILYLSYKHLPVWLKPCFLYLGLYPEDDEIKVSQLIKLWVAEGFIRSKTEQSLEEIAENYTKELVDRNLLLVVRLTRDKKLKRCRVHDVVRELCMRIGEKENYFCVQRDIQGMRHFIVDEATARLFYPRKSPSILRPLILEGQKVAQSKSRLLRVSFLDYRTHPENSSQQVNLRFLCVAGYDVWSEFRPNLSKKIQLHWSLQTLIIDLENKSFDAPSEIWKMPQFRHIDISRSISLPDPPSPTCEDDINVLQNLQSLKRVKNLVLTEEVCKRIPNIKKLGIVYEFHEPGEATSCYHLHNLGCFNKLESLNLLYLATNYPDGDLFKKMKLPSSLKELKLEGCNLEWSDHMEMIASLPHLQVLKLNLESFKGSEWDCVEGGFLCLKHLEIDACCDLIKWSADSSSFPVLETLSLLNLPKLKEIPSGIGEIPTLERMDVELCSESASMSAVKIVEEQESLGNDSLQLTIEFTYSDAAEMFRGKIQQWGITCQNLHIKGGY